MPFGGFFRPELTIFGDDLPMIGEVLASFAAIFFSELNAQPNTILLYDDHCQILDNLNPPTTFCINNQPSARSTRFFHRRSSRRHRRDGKSRQRGPHRYGESDQGRFPGKIFPVNPKRDTVLGIKAYPSITAVPEKPDLAVIITPPKTVPGIIKDCAQTGVPGAIIISAGFKEIGAEGAELERQVLEEATRPASASSARTVWV